MSKLFDKPDVDMPGNPIPGPGDAPDEQAEQPPELTEQMAKELFNTPDPEGGAGVTDILQQQLGVMTLQHGIFEEMRDLLTAIAARED